MSWRFQLLTLKFRCYEKATKFDEIFILVLTSLSDVKTKMDISSNFVAFSENLNFSNKSIFRNLMKPEELDKIMILATLWL